MTNPLDPTSPGINATDDPAIAEQHGLTEYDEERGQYVAPVEGDEDESADVDENESNEELLAATSKGEVDDEEDDESESDEDALALDRESQTAAGEGYDEDGHDGQSSLNDSNDSVTFRP